MRNTRNTDRHESAEVITPPSACPSCQSADLKTTSKVVTVQTYWRCMACGEVWNVARREINRPTFRTFGR